jgi:peroxiredoxin
VTALATGKKAPDFTLLGMDGQQFSLKQALLQGPVVLAFFKISCPVCQYAFPFLERIHQAYGNKKVAIVGVSQNSKKDTQLFVNQFGLTFTVLLDDTNSYPVSNAYGLTNVPSIFWIDPDGTIKISSVGWVKQEVEEINQKAAQIGQTPLRPVFLPDEQVPEYRPG